MNLSLLFKVQGIVLIVNGLGSLFLGSGTQIGGCASSLYPYTSKSFTSSLT